MRFAVLGSGSRGNSLYVEEGTTAILIDNGFSGKKLATRMQGLDCRIDALTAICITHEHNDHVAGVGVVSRRCKVPVYGNSGSFAGAEKKLGKLHKRCEFNTGDVLEIGDLRIQSFPVSHDTADPVGYVISNGRQYLGYCTDTGMATKLMEIRLSRCHALVLEFNHNLEMLKNGPYPLPLQQRVRSSRGHLANEDSAGLLKKLVHPSLRYAVLAHLSETNNTADLAAAAARPCLSQELQTELILAEQDRSTRLLEL